jgi:hypothetical protein
MDEATGRTVGEVFRQVLEKQCFLFADPDDGAGFRDAGPCVAATMGFRGEIDGRLALVLPESLLPEIAANFLGMEPDDPEALAGGRDACKEILNITCGNALTALRGEEPVFDLTIPEVDPATPGEAADWSALPGAIRFSVDGAPILLLARIGGPEGPLLPGREG